MAEAREESLAEAVEGARQEARAVALAALADAATLQALTGDCPQLGQEVPLLPLGNAVLGDTEVSLGSRAEQGRQGQSWAAISTSPSQGAAWAAPHLR